MFSRPHYVAFVAVLLIGVVLLNLPEPAVATAKRVVASPLVPLFGLLGSVEGLAEHARFTLRSRTSLQAEILRLEQEVARLQIGDIQSGAVMDENDRLRQALGWQRQLRWKSRMARVIARDPENWWRSLRIDLGSRDGLRSNLPVLVADGLVGRIGEVGLATSEVVMVGDPKCRVAVLVRETGENGIISAVAIGVLDHRLVELSYLPRHSLLRPGQSVYTSGLGEVFPAGIPVGTVVDSRSVSFGLMTEARIKLGVDSSRLREVAVLVP